MFDFNARDIQRQSFISVEAAARKCYEKDVLNILQYSP